MSLRSSGYNAAASVVKQATQINPSHASKNFTRMHVKKCVDIVPYSDIEALALMIDANLSKSQYLKMRKSAKQRNANLYPSYNKVLLAKQNCYPDGIKITETLMEIPLQALLDHTCLRIIQATTELENFSANELLQVHNRSTQ